MDYLRGIIGLVFIVGVAYLLSVNRKKIDWRLVAIGLFIQIVIGLLIAKVGFVRGGFEFVSEKFVIFLSFAKEGSRFVFGQLADDTSNLGFIFAFQALPTVIFFSAVTAGLYYLGVLQKIVYGFAWIMSKSMRLSGAESLSAAANIFMGQTEAPLLVRPFIATMTRSELFFLL